MAGKKFDINDLKRWQESNLISKEQLDSILSAEDLKAGPATKERKPGLNLITVVYYFGGFLALLSFTLFIGISWMDLSDWARFGIVLVAMLGIGGIGAWLKFKQNYPTAGGLLIFVSTAIVPVAIYTITVLLDIWPAGASFYELRFAILLMALVSLIASGASLYFTRFSLIALLVAAAAHVTLLDMAQLIGGESFAAGEANAAITGSLLLLGTWLKSWQEKPYAFWIQLYGLVAFQVTFTALFVESESLVFGLLFLLVYLIFIGASLWLRQVILLVFGAIGFYTYIFRLVFDVFKGEAYFSLILGLTGLSIIVLAVLYQKYGHHLFRRRIN